MILLYEGTFDETSIQAGILGLGNKNITAVNVINGDLAVDYAGEPTTTELGLIQVVINSHDATPDATQQLKNLTKSVMVQMAISAETSLQIGWIVGSFNSALEDIRSAYVDETPQELLDASYAAWRIIYDALAAPIQADMVLFSAFFNDPAGNTYTEPETVTSAYKVWFNVSIRDFLEYVTDRLQMK